MARSRNARTALNRLREQRAELDAREAQLREEAARVRESWLRAQIGRPLSVLAERDGTGHAENFARVAVPEGTPPGTIVTITPRQVQAGILI